MSKEPEKEVYRIYLLTIRKGGDQQWQFVIEDPRTGKRKGFADIATLIVGLLKMSSEDPESAEHDSVQDDSTQNSSAAFPGC